MRLLAIDPGETVGWAIFDGIAKVDGGQTDWGEFPFQLADAFGVTGPAFVLGAAGQHAFHGVERIVMEDFVIYPPDVSSGPPPPWDQVITARLIGQIQLVADLAGVPVEYQGADIKSDALKAAAREAFSTPLHENRHENDATMHGTFYLSRAFAAQLDTGGSL